MYARAHVHNGFYFTASGLVFPVAMLCRHTVCVCVYGRYWCNRIRHRWSRSKSVTREHGDRPYTPKWERHREAARFLFNSRPSHLLQPVCSPSPHPSSSSFCFLPPPAANHPRHCVTRTRLQINRLQRVMKDRRGYERWGGGRERGGDPSFHGDRTGVLLVEQMTEREHICVLIRGFRGAGETRRCFFSPRFI